MCTLLIQLLHTTIVSVCTTPAGNFKTVGPLKPGVLQKDIPAPCLHQDHVIPLSRTSRLSLAVKSCITEPTAEASAKLKSALRQLKILQWTLPAFAGAGIFLSAQPPTVGRVARGGLERKKHFAFQSFSFRGTNCRPCDNEVVACQDDGTVVARSLQLSGDRLSRRHAKKKLEHVNLLDRMGGHRKVTQRCGAAPPTRACRSPTLAQSVASGHCRPRSRSSEGCDHGGR